MIMVLYNDNTLTINLVKGVYLSNEISICNILLPHSAREIFGFHT